MRILFITPYPFNQAPSQRFRFEQYLDILKENNIEYDIAPFLDQPTWEVFYKPRKTSRKLIGIIKGIYNRFKLLSEINKKYDVLFIHREACSIGPGIFEYLFRKLFKGKIIFDFDDAIWLRDVSDAHVYLGWLKNPSKTAGIITKADIVISGNNYLADYAKKYNKRVHVIPTTIDTSYHFPVNKKNSAGAVTIGWTGSETTIKHFQKILPVLKKVKEKYGDKVRFILISNKPVFAQAASAFSPSRAGSTPLKDITIEFIPWKKETEIEDLSKIDIGIMPLPDDKWTRGKCGFKGLQYMALEIPTVMSPVGVNTEIIQDGVNGFLAETEQEWVEKLSLLIESEELRRQIGKKGRETVTGRYSVESQKQKFLSIICFPPEGTD